MRLKQFKLKPVLYWFILIQPFLDIYYLYQPPISTFLKFSPATIIRIVMVMIISVGFLYEQRHQRATRWLIGGYIGLLGLYFIGHQYTAMQFHSLVAGNFNYSLFGEIFYMIRMVLPLIIMLISYRTTFTENEIEKLVSWLVGLISGSIVITNFLKIGLASYTNQRITGSIVDWFAGAQSGSYFQLASKGFFNFANSTAAIETLLFPILLYFLIKHFNAKNIILVIVQLLAMFMLGTKVATLGSMLVIAAMLLLYLFFTFIKREQIFNYQLLIFFAGLILGSAILYHYSPAVNRTNFDAQIQQERDGDKDKVQAREDELKKEERKHDKSKDSPLVRYIGENFEKFSINGRFIEVSYPYYDDPQFWSEVMKWPIEKRISFRTLEIAMLNRVKSINNNPLDNYFGITYTRMNNIFNLERDFLSQYYSMGIFGVMLFVLPYLLMLLVAGYLMLRHFKTLMTMRNASFALGIVMILGVSIYSGNVMDFLTATFILAFFEGQLVQKLVKQPLFKNKKISILMPSYNDGDSIEQTLQSVIQQDYDNWELLIMDDGSIDQTKVIVTNFIERYQMSSKIRYFYQENQDQLRALLNLSDQVTGEIVYILDSDDLLASRFVLKNANQAMNDPELDGIVGNMQLIDESGKTIGQTRANSYLGDKRSVKQQTLWLGRNLYYDLCFWRKSAFNDIVKENYLKWNTVSWLDLRYEQPEPLNLDNVNFAFISYRIHEGNYINSELGTLNVLNGELRTLTTLLSKIKIPKYQLQYQVFRIFNKLKLLSCYQVIAFSKKTPPQTVAKILSFMLVKRLVNFNEYQYLSSLVGFYQNYQDKTINWQSIQPEKKYIGADMRAFNQSLLTGQTADNYQPIFNAMQTGFNVVEVKADQEQDCLNCLTFLNIAPYVKLKVVA